MAGSIGRLSLAVFGTDYPESAEPRAEALGVALQVTNILRDVVEDRTMGRAYLPRDEAAALGCAPDLSGPTAALTALVAAQVPRAKEHFAYGLQLLPLLDRRSRACVAAMAGIYRQLLARIEADPGRVLRERVSLLGAGEGVDRHPQPRGRSCLSPPERRGRGRRVAVIGGGLAGITAALDAADAGAEVTLARTAHARLGGRTWSFEHNGLTFDNGQHVFMRCCTSYRAFVERIGGADMVTLQPTSRRAGAVPGAPARSDRTDRPAGARSTSPASLAALPPVGAGRSRASAVRRARRLGIGRSRRPGERLVSFGSWLAEHGQDEQAIAALWDLVGRPTLNLPAADASLALAAEGVPHRPARLAPTPPTSAGRLVPLAMLHDDARRGRARRGAASRS